jgi:hypothetical protein
MAASTKHALEQRAARKIKQHYIDQCITKGKLEYVPSTTSNNLETPHFLHRHYYNGLVVISTPSKYEKKVITAYWVYETDDDIKQCIGRFKFEKEKRRRDAVKAQEAKAQCSKKTNSKHGRGRHTSVRVEEEELRDFEF